MIKTNLYIIALLTVSFGAWASVENIVQMTRTTKGNFKITCEDPSGGSYPAQASSQQILANAVCGPGTPIGISGGVFEEGNISERALLDLRKFSGIVKNASLTIATYHNYKNPGSFVPQQKIDFECYPTGECANATEQRLVLFDDGFDYYSSKTSTAKHYRHAQLSTLTPKRGNYQMVGGDDMNVRSIQVNQEGSNSISINIGWKDGTTAQNVPFSCNGFTGRCTTSSANFDMIYKSDREIWITDHACSYYKCMHSDFSK